MSSQENPTNKQGAPATATERSEAKPVGPKLRTWQVGRGMFAIRRKSLNNEGDACEIVMGSVVATMQGFNPELPLRVEWWALDDQSLRTTEMTEIETVADPGPATFQEFIETSEDELDLDIEKQSQHVAMDPPSLVLASLALIGLGSFSTALLPSAIAPPWLGLTLFAVGVGVMWIRQLRALRKYK